jgi:hypothetical protein
MDPVRPAQEFYIGEYKIASIFKRFFANIFDDLVFSIPVYISRNNDM